MFTLPDLPYQYDELAPFISADIQHLHHDKHHRAYVDNLNKTLGAFPAWKDKTIEEIIVNLNELPQEIETAVRNNGGGHFNHSMFWQMMSPKKQEPSGTLKDKLEHSFGDIKTFKDKFSQDAAKVFGSGWQWLIIEGGELKLMSTPNQDNPLTSGQTPLLGLDVWEHAYYLQYYNKRPDYIEAWWNVVNWDDVSKRLTESI